MNAPLIIAIVAAALAISVGALSAKRVRRNERILIERFGAFQKMAGVNETAGGYGCDRQQREFPGVALLNEARQPVVELGIIGKQRLKLLDRFSIDIALFK